MQHTTNYNLNKFEATDLLEDTSRLGLNSNFDTIDTALKEASENGGIAVQDTQPTTDVLAWVDSDQLGADFCFVGDTAPANDGSVAVWVDTQNKAIKTLVGGVWTNVYDNATTTTAGLMSASDKTKLDNNTVFPTTDEVVVGTWVDGKPIYRKRFTGTTAATGNTTALDNLGIYDRGISVYGDVNGSLINAYLNATFFTGIWINTTSHLPVLYYPDTAEWHEKPYDIVIDYTKTTD